MLYFSILRKFRMCLVVYCSRSGHFLSKVAKTWWKSKLLKPTMKMSKFSNRRHRHDNSTTLPIGQRFASFDDGVSTSSSSSSRSSGDPNVPVVYQMIKAEVQNLLDKMTNAQIQDVVESATKIRDQALLLKSPVKLDVPAGTLFPAEELSPISLAYSSTGRQANRLVNELSIRRKEELKLFRSLSCGARSTVGEVTTGKKLRQSAPAHTPVAFRADEAQAEVLPVILEQDENENLERPSKTRKGLETNGNGVSSMEQGIPSVVLNLGNVPSTSDVVGLAKSQDADRKLTVDGVQNDGQVIDILIEAARADHLIPLEELEIKLNTSKDFGLNSRQVQTHRQRDGSNILKQKSPTPVWLHFLKSLVGGFGAVLWLAALLCFLAYWPLGDPPDRYNLVLGFVLLAVIFVQGYFSFRQERKASNLIAGFLNMMPMSCQVLRDGSWILAPAQDLVVGDVIRVKEGDKLPADIRVFEVNEAKIEKSSLTGESEPIALSPYPTDRNIYETQNMALFGTSVLEGTAAGLVVNTGDRTVMGKIAQMTCTTKSVKTTLQREIEHFLIVVAVLSIVTCALTLLIFYFVIDKAHPGFLSTAVMVTNCIAITVAVLPDGLPISVTTILTLVGRRLHREMILVKDFSITETLGSATLIASDKTGTITMNHMTLKHLWIGCKKIQIKGQESAHCHLARKQSLVYDESSVDYLEKTIPGCYNVENMGKTVEDPAVAFLLQLMCMCNKASFETPRGRQTPKWCKNPEAEKIVGTPTEGALLAAGESFFDVSKFRLKVPIVDEIPFNSRRKFHLTVHRIVDDSVFVTTEFFIRQKTAQDHRQADNDEKNDQFSYYHSESEYRIVSPDGCGNLVSDDDDSLLLTSKKFITKNKSVARQKRDFNFMTVVKGAPEYILGMCIKAVFDGREEKLKAESISQIMKANEKLAAEGERVLALAFKRLPSNLYPADHVFNLRHQSEEETKNFTLLGLVGIIDPPRPGVGDAIKECHEAGIRVMMVTGDHPTTAVAISRMVNIITNRKVKNFDDIVEVCRDNSESQEFSGNNIKIKRSNKFSNMIREKMRQIFGQNLPRKFLHESLVVTGKDLHNLNEKQWDHVLSHREIVFARTTPQQKLQIVKESQKRGDIIAVTGDGVNDAPALKAAHLGVAMGVCGSDISKEAANMVLLDDNFVTIVNGIKQGRLLFDNLKKVVCYLLPAGSFSEILPVLACVFLGLPQPLSAFLMIVICIGTDVCGSLGLVHEEAEFDLMTRPPRDSKNDRLVNWQIILFTYCFVGAIESAIAFSMYFYTMWLGGVPADTLLFAYENWGRPLNVTHYHTNYANFSETAEITTVIIDPITQETLNAKAQTAFFVSLVVTQLWSLVSVRTRFQSSLRQKFDRRLLWYMGGELGIVLIICYLPFFQRTMNIQPAEWYHFLVPALLGSTIFGADELRKFFARKWPNGIFKRLAW